MTTRVLILGAGFAGLELSTRLSESGEDVRVTLVDQSEGFVFGFSKLEVLFGHKTVEDIWFPYGSFVHERVDLRREMVTAIHPAQRRVETDAGTHEADVLVVALGADLDPAATPGFVEGGFEFYSVPGTERARDAIAAFEGGEIVVAVLGVPFKCPPAPYEATLLLHDDLVERGIRDTASITVITPMDSPIPVSKETSEAIVAALEERGITYRPGTKVTSLRPGAKRASLTDGSEIPYDLFLGIPVHRAPAVVRASGLTEGGTDGWIAVDPATLRTRFPGVYALGDNADPPIPRAGVFAESAAGVVADEILADLRGAEGPGRFDGTGICYIEFGGGLVGKVDANFLGGPSPSVAFGSPSAELRREKERFASVRSARWFGR